MSFKKSSRVVIFFFISVWTIFTCSIDNLSRHVFDLIISVDQDSIYMTNRNPVAIFSVMEKDNKSQIIDNKMISIVMILSGTWMYLSYHILKRSRSADLSGKPIFFHHDLGRRYCICPYVIAPLMTIVDS